MTVKDLKKIIESLPDNMDVVIEKVNDEFNLSLLEKAEVKECTFSEDEHSEVSAKEDCLVLSDDL